MHDKMREIESYQRKKSILRLKIEWGSELERERGVWKVRRQKGSREIEKKWEKCHTDPIYRNLNFSMDWEVSTANKLRWIEELSRICREVSTAKRARWIEKLSTIYQASRKFLNGSSSCWEAIENGIKRSWKGSIDSLAVKRCPAAVKIA